MTLNSAITSGTRRSGRARWADIADALRARVVAGEWKPGEAIPAESALAAHYAVALGTMRAAIEPLVTQGVLERVHGRGTFVREGLSGHGLERFFRWSGEPGRMPDSRIRSIRRVRADAVVARALELRAGSEVLRIVRHRSLEGQLILHETLSLPLKKFAVLEKQGLASIGPLLYPEYARVAGVTVHRAVDDLSFASLGTRLGVAFGLPATHPAIRVERRAFDLAGDPVEHRITWGDAHQFHYRAEVR